MVIMMLVLHAGHWGGAYHPGFFPFAPGLLWLGLAVLFVIYKSTVARQGPRHDGQPRPPAAPPEAPDSGPAWPELYPDRPMPRTPQQDKGEREIL